MHEKQLKKFVHKAVEEVVKEMNDNAQDKTATSQAFIKSIVAQKMYQEMVGKHFKPDHLQIVKSKMDMYITSKLNAMQKLENQSEKDDTTTD